jgi:acyl-[acyl carrier protein]--UDP-N-acetylglucosamine O-acyltransferase
VNDIGLQRAGYEQKVIDELWEAYKSIYRTRELNRTKIYDQIERNPNASPETLYLVQFLRRSQRGIHGRHRERLRKG